jgi:multimeric flavodoxin WrbA
MKVLGISGSPRPGMTTDKLVEKTLEATGCETEFVSLSRLKIGPCIGCLACVEDNICKVKDDMAGLRQKILDADAYVIGAANYFSMPNGLTHCFMERLYQFRHREFNGIAGKLGVAVGAGGSNGDFAVQGIKTFFTYNRIKCVGEVSAQGPAPCFVCGYGEDCKVGAIHMFFGAGTKITPEITPDISKQPEKLKEAAAAGRLLGERLRSLASAS